MKACTGISCKVTNFLQRLEISLYRLSQKVL